MSVRRTITICANALVLTALATPQVPAQSETVALRGRDAVSQMPSPDSARARQSPQHSQAAITLDLHQAPLKEALRSIAAQAKVVMFYNDGDIAAQAPVTMSVSSVSIDSALQLVLRHTELTARVTDAGIVIERKKAPGLEARPRAQEGSIHGQIRDAKTGQGIDGAMVTVDESHLHATSDDSGEYRISRIAPGQHSIRVKRVGYESIVRVVAVIAYGDVVVNFALQPAATILNQVVVTGTVVPTEVKALPSPITVITAQQIARQHAFTLSAIFRQAVPTAVAFDTPNVPASTDFSVRGVSSLNGNGDMKIFVDGVEATTFGDSPVDPASISRIEVVRGPEAATIYGSDAASGVIQIFTKRGDSSLTRPQVNARMSLGMSQTPYTGFGNVLRQQYGGSVSGGGQNFSYNFGGSYMHLGDYAPENGTTRQSAPSVYGGVTFSRNIFTADVSARYYQDETPLAFNPLLAATGYAAGSPPFYYLSWLTNQTVGTRMTLTPVPWWRNQLTLGVDRFGLRNKQTQPRRTTDDDTLLLFQDEMNQKISVGFNSTMSGTLTPALGASLTLGVDHYTQDASDLYTSQALNTSGTILIAPSGALNESLNTIRNTGYFAQAQVSARNALFLTGGVRAEKNTTFGAEFGTVVLPRAGLSFVQPVGGMTMKVRVSYGKALRAPSAGQASGLVAASSIQLANPDLKPERQEGWDGGVDLVFGNRASLSVTGFDQTAKDLISFLQVASTPNVTYQYQNIGRVSNKGVELEATLGIVQWLQVRGQYGYVRSRIEAVGAAGGQVEAGDEPVGVPTHTAGLSLSASPRDGTTATVGVTYVGSWRQADGLLEYRCLASFTADACPASFLSTGSIRDFNVMYPGFAKVNATVSHRFTRRFQAFVSMDNLTNNDAYEFSNASPVIGRTTTVGIQLTY